MINEQNFSLTDTELDELDHFLREQMVENDQEALLLDGVHGLLTALAVGPQPAQPDEWLPEVLHQPFMDATQGRHILGLLARLNDSICSELDADCYEPILGEMQDEQGQAGISTAGWCSGFAQGMDLRSNIWELRLDEDIQLVELLAPVMELAAQDGALGDNEVIDLMSEQEYGTRLAELPEIVDAMAQYWRVRPPLGREQQSVSKDAAVAYQRRSGHSVH